jgi:hypothetical protein
MISHLVRTLALTAICAASIANVAAASTIYDGEWSVLIVTDSGACDRAYRYGVQINNGIVNYLGGGGVAFKGRVASNGSVRVNVVAGNNEASGQGRMSRNAGQGRWGGHSATGTCKGYWTAERRG